MAAMSTSLTEFSDKENSRTYILSGHTVLKPQLVIQKRKVAATPTSSAEDLVNVVFGTLDAEGNPLQSKVSFSTTIRRPSDGDDADVAAAKAVFLDIVNSDEFAAMVTSQGYLK